MGLLSFRGSRTFLFNEIVSSVLSNETDIERSTKNGIKPEIAMQGFHLQFLGFVKEEYINLFTVE